MVKSVNCSSMLHNDCFIKLKIRSVHNSIWWCYSSVEYIVSFWRVCCLFNDFNGNAKICLGVAQKLLETYGIKNSLVCCRNLSGGVELIVRFTTNGMCVTNNTIMYVARTSNNRVISSGDLCCCLLSRCEQHEWLRWRQWARRYRNAPCSAELGPHNARAQGEHTIRSQQALITSASHHHRAPHAHRVPAASSVNAHHLPHATQVSTHDPPCPSRTSL